MGVGRYSEYLVTASWLVSVILLSSKPFISPAAGLKCPGKCISNTTECKLGGGKIAGYCTNDRACCDSSYKKMGSCGSKMSKLTTAIVMSPDYPDSSGGDLICQFDFVLSTNATGIIVEFSDIVMDGTGLAKGSSCESDMFFFKGFPDWTPPPFSAVIDLGNRHTKGMSTFTILAILSSSKYKWNIKVSQVSRDKTKSLHSFSTPRPVDYTDSDEYLLEDIQIRDDADKSTSLTNTVRFFTAVEEDEESEEEEITRLVQLAKRLNLKRSKPARVQRSLEESDKFGGDYYSEGGLEEEPFIVNGDDSEIVSLPWQASLRTTVSAKAAKHLPALGLDNYTLTEGLHFCGGSVISSRHILSAAHCFFLGEKLSAWQRLSVMKIVLGDSNTCDELKDNVQEFKVDKVYFHYAYDDRVILNDLVVIKLKGRIKFNDYVRPIKMAKVGMYFEHQEALASGWGLTNLTSEDQNTAKQLQSSGDFIIGNRSYCSKEQMKLYSRIKRVQLLRYPKYANVFSSLLCTHVKNGSVPRLVGQGDSGGPLVVHPEDDPKKEPLLVGVISYMIPIPHSIKPHDVSLYVDFYQSVAFFRNWIDLAMQ